jgi:hypothetical protein
MPVVAALLFEFCLRELRLRTLAGQAGSTLNAWRWLHPAEHIRVQIRMAAGEQVSAEAATRHVRVNHAARRLYQLKTALDARDRSPAHGAMAVRRVRKAEHRAHRALTRAGFADPATATAVLRQVQVLTMTTALVRLDYHIRIVAEAAHDGGRLSQVSLAERLRREGYTVANSRLRWLSSVSGLQPRHAAGPDPPPPGGP